MLLRHSGKDARIARIRDRLAQSQHKLQREQRRIARCHSRKRRGRRPQQVPKHQHPAHGETVGQLARNPKQLHQGIGPEEC